MSLNIREALINSDRTTARKPAALDCMMQQATPMTTAEARRSPETP
jgi:hypothetical protein